MRILLIVAVILLFVDAFFYSGVYTQSAYSEVKTAANQFVDYISDTVEVQPDGET